MTVTISPQRFNRKNAAFFLIAFAFSIAKTSASPATTPPSAKCFICKILSSVRWGEALNLIPAAVNNCLRTRLSDAKTIKVLPLFIHFCPLLFLWISSCKSGRLFWRFNAQKGPFFRFRRRIRRFSVLAPKILHILLGTWRGRRLFLKHRRHIQDAVLMRFAKPIRF